MIWTIYNHGTGAASTKDLTGEIVNYFGNSDPTPLFDGKIITEGVGSIGDPKDLVQRFSRDARTGQYGVHRTQGSSNKLSRFVQMSAGTGVKENVDNTMELIRALNLAGRCPTQINMLGWSRGAVTCIRLAYALSQSQDPVLRNIPVNIFAIDPVAGFGHNTEADAITINANVRNYVATMAAGEQRFFFKPIAAQRLNITSPGATASWVIPIPGVHNQTATINNFAGRLTADLAYRFLTTSGTNLQPLAHVRMGRTEAWKCYEAMMPGNPTIAMPGAAPKTTNWKTALTTGGGKFVRSSETRRLGMGSKFFINYHAEKVFEAAYPVCYNAYFSPGEISKRNTLSWATRYSRAIVAEQNQNGMSQMMRDLLQDLPAAAAVPTVPSQVTNVITAMNLVG